MTVSDVHGNGDGMFAVEHADQVAIRRAFMVSVRERALVELRRRYMGLTDMKAPNRSRPYHGDAS